MYNYQTYRREQIVEQQCDQLRKEHDRAVASRQSNLQDNAESNPSLVHSHKKRIEGFILSMIDKPVQVCQYRNYPQVFRHEDSSKNLAASAFYLRHQTQTQRIQEAQRRNRELDQVPFSNTYGYQFRDLGQEGKPMRYKPLNHNFRIKEYLDRGTLNYLPNENNRKVDKVIKRARSKDASDVDSINKSLNKSLLPMLHNKTYFKSVATLYSELPVFPNYQQPKFYEKPTPSHQQNYDDAEVEVRKGAKATDHMSRKQNSREALLKCGMLSFTKGQLSNSNTTASLLRTKTYQKLRA